MARGVPAVNVPYRIHTGTRRSRHGTKRSGPCGYGRAAGEARQCVKIHTATGGRRSSFGSVYLLTSYTSAAPVCSRPRPSDDCRLLDGPFIPLHCDGRFAPQFVQKAALSRSRLPHPAHSARSSTDWRPSSRWVAGDPDHLPRSHGLAAAGISAHAVVWSAAVISRCRRSRTSCGARPEPCRRSITISILHAMFAPLPHGRAAHHLREQVLGHRCGPEHLSVLPPPGRSLAQEMGNRSVAREQCRKSRCRRAEAISFGILRREGLHGQRHAGGLRRSVHHLSTDVYRIKSAMAERRLRACAVCAVNGDSVTDTLQSRTRRSVSSCRRSLREVSGRRPSEAPRSAVSGSHAGQE
jgi:hypothetical protein